MDHAIITDPLLGIDHEKIGEKEETKKRRRRTLEIALFLVLILVGISGLFLFFLIPPTFEEQFYDLTGAYLLFSDLLLLD